MPKFYDNTIAYFEVFKGSGSNWSFAQTLSDSDVIIRTAEKERISDLCSTGLYFFKSASLFLDAYEQSLTKTVIGEHYVAPLYNYVIQYGIARVLPINSCDVRFYGIPSEYLDFVQIQMKTNE